MVLIFLLPSLQEETDGGNHLEEGGVHMEGGGRRRPLTLPQAIMQHLAQYYDALKPSDLSRLFWSLARMDYRDIVEEDGAARRGSVDGTATGAARRGEDDGTAKGAASGTEGASDPPRGPKPYLLISDLIASACLQLQQFSPYDLAYSLWGVSLLEDRIRGSDRDRIVKGLSEAITVGGGRSLGASYGLSILSTVIFAYGNIPVCTVPVYNCGLMSPYVLPCCLIVA